MIHLHSCHTFFNMWNIFEDVLKYFVSDNDYKLFIAFQLVDVYLTNQLKLIN